MQQLTEVPRGLSGCFDSLVQGHANLLYQKLLGGNQGHSVALMPLHAHSELCISASSLERHGNAII